MNYLKKKASYYFALNVVINIPVLFVLFTIFLTGSFFDFLSLFVFGSIFLGVEVLLNSCCFLIFSDSFSLKISNVYFCYLIGPSTLFFIFYLLDVNQELPFVGLFLFSTPFFIGQIISLFLILKHIKEDSAKNLPA